MPCITTDLMHLSKGSDASYVVFKVLFLAELGNHSRHCLQRACVTVIELESCWCGGYDGQVVW